MPECASFVEENVFDVISGWFSKSRREKRKKERELKRSKKL
jgi:hypothetical protein